MLTGEVTQRDPVPSTLSLPGGQRWQPHPRALLTSGRGRWPGWTTQKASKRFGDTPPPGTLALTSQSPSPAWSQPNPGQGRVDGQRPGSGSSAKQEKQPTAPVSQERKAMGPAASQRWLRPLPPPLQKGGAPSLARRDTDGLPAQAEPRRPQPGSRCTGWVPGWPAAPTGARPQPRPLGGSQERELQGGRVALRPALPRPRLVPAWVTAPRLPEHPACASCCAKHSSPEC